MTSSAVRPGGGASRRTRLRGAGAVAAVMLFFGTAALAPFSIPDALASDQENQRFDEHDTQDFVSAEAADPSIDLSVSEVQRLSAETKAVGEEKAPAGALYTLQQFMFSGVVNWGGYRFTYYSQQVLPGGGLRIPGRHVNAGGYVSDGDGYIVLAGSAPLGTVFKTPFGYPGKIYDRGTSGNHLDVYIR